MLIFHQNLIMKLYMIFFWLGTSFYKFTIEKIKDNIKYLNLKSLEKFPLKLIEKCKSELTGIYIKEI